MASGISVTIKKVKLVISPKTTNRLTVNKKATSRENKAYQDEISDAALMQENEFIGTSVEETCRLGAFDGFTVPSRREATAFNSDWIDNLYFSYSG